MKKLTKILFVAGGSLLLTGGAVANYLLAQQENQPLSDLTLANMEGMAGPIIIDQGQTALIPDQRNNPKGAGCIDKGGTCEISNNGGW